MMIKQKMLVFCIFFGLNSCGLFEKKKNSSSSKPEVKKYFVHGDPMNVIKGAKLNKLSFINLEEIANFNEFHFAGGLMLTEKDEEEELKDWDQVEKENSTEATSIEEVFSLYKFRFVKETENRYIYHGKINDTVFNIGFDVIDGKLVLSDINGDKAQMLHYSLKDDGRAFSFLMGFQGGKDQGKVLFSLSFVDSSIENTIPNGIKDYAYILSNIPLKWEKNDIEINICGDYDASTESTLSNSIKAWTQKDGDSSTSIKINNLKDYPPYSDLNHHCIQLVNDFKMENSYQFVIAGVTLPTINLAEKNIIDSDVFIFTSHVDYDGIGSAEQTTVHEIGHFLGLGHEFKRHEDDSPLYESIMGYENGKSSVTDHDKTVMNSLYEGDLKLIE